MIVDFYKLGPQRIQAIERTTGRQIGGFYPGIESAKGGVLQHARAACVEQVVPEPGAIEAWETA